MSAIRGGGPCCSPTTAAHLSPHRRAMPAPKKPSGSSLGASAHGGGVHSAVSSSAFPKPLPPKSRSRRLQDRRPRMQDRYATENPLETCQQSAAIRSEERRVGKECVSP